MFSREQYIMSNGKLWPASLPATAEKTLQVVSRYSFYRKRDAFPDAMSYFSLNNARPMISFIISVMPHQVDKVLSFLDAKPQL